jgi:hypothetical protein
VLLYLIRLADILGIDLAVAATAKLAASELRYPVGAQPPADGHSPSAST